MGYFDDIFGNSDSFSDNLKMGKDFYLENGYRVMTESYLINRGYCCSNGCRHCPYWPKAQKGNTVLKKASPGLPTNRDKFSTGGE